MIVDKLRQIELTDDEIKSLSKDMDIWSEFCATLQNIELLTTILKYLKVEILTRQRSYFISRIYGRYRRLEPVEELTNLANYVMEVRRAKKVKA